MRALSFAAMFANAIFFPLAAQTFSSPAPVSSTTAPLLGLQPQQFTLTSEQAATWKDKPVYSSDDKKIGEVNSIRRGTDNGVIDMLADIGGFMGIGETRIRLTPSQFVLRSDRVVLSITRSRRKPFQEFGNSL